MAIGLVGTTTGMFVGCSIALSILWLLPALGHILGIQFLTPSVYFLSELPSKLVATDVIEIGAIGVLMSSLETLYPSWRSSRVRPAEALRYERATRQGRGKTVLQVMDCTGRHPGFPGDRSSGVLPQAHRV
jgi:lipoprotein-releasing system permease protein